MKPRRSHAPLALAAALAASGAQAVQFTVDDLGPGAGSGINASGQVAIGVPWGQFGGQPSAWWGINDAGAMVGQASDEFASWHAVRITGRRTHVLPSPYGSTAPAIAQAVNNAGWVAGFSWGDNPSSPRRAVVWSPADTPLRLGTLAGDDISEAYGINNAGTVVGTSELNPFSTERTSRAFRWTATDGMVALPGLPGPPASAYATALAINDAGTVVGISNNRAVVWQGGAVLDLGVGSAQQPGRATAVNALDQVVGWHGGSSGAGAFLWSAHGGVRDLGSMLAPGSGWQLAEAGGINALGQIAATSTTHRALRLTPGGSLAWVGHGRAPSFNDATQWEMGFAPRAVFDAAIDPKQAVVITLDADASVNRLGLGAATGPGPTLRLVGGATLTAAQGVQVHASGRLAGSGQIAGAVRNSGVIAPTDLAIGGGLENHGRIDGPGRLAAVLNNTAEGQVQVGSGASLTIAAAATHLNAGLLAVNGGGALRFEGAVSNLPSGRIQLDKGRLDLADGLRNGGVLATTAGGAAVHGALQNLKAGLVLATAGSNLSFDGAFTNGGEVRAEAGSRIVFRGAVDGTGAFQTDRSGALLRFEGGLSPGASAAALSLGHSDIASLLTMAWGAAGHSHIAFDGPVQLDTGSALALQFTGGFQGTAGLQLDLFDFQGAPAGSFGALWLPTLADGLVWDSTALYSEGALRIAAVPEPATLGLWALGLALGRSLSARRRRRPAAA